MKHLKKLISFSCAAALACGVSGPLPSVPSALAAEADSAEATASAGSSASSSESGASSSSSSSSAEDSGEQAKPGKTSGSKEDANSQKGESGSKGASKTEGKSDAKSGSGSKAKSKAGEASADAGKSAKEKAAEEKAKKEAEEKAKEKSDGKDGLRKPSGEDPAKYAKKIPALVTKLAAVPDEFGEAKNVTRAYKAKLAKVAKKRAALQKEQQRAQNVLDDMESELAAGTTATLTMVLTGKADFDSIDSRGYLLQKVADGSSARIEQVKKQLAKLDKRETKLKKQEKAEVKAIAKEHQDTTKASIAKGNELAAKIERCVSLMRYAEPESTAAHAALRESALSQVAQWYEFEDAMAGNENVLTFGTGTEFDLSKKAFVKKWGAAIDAFYKDNYAGSPLEGHGAEMAEAAWERKIDPRLCAAVSIIESTGGRYCIKPHNAWGWGAADSDPYGGASGWDSWADAIVAWHDGLANSTTGLATAPTVEELGEIYCSSLDWAAKVVGEMQKISAEAE